MKNLVTFACRRFSPGGPCGGMGVIGDMSFTQERRIYCHATGESFTHYRDYLKSDHWDAVKFRVFSARGWKCQDCGSGKRLEVHHLSYSRIGHEADSDLQVLCFQCHKAKHPGKAIKRSCRPYRKRRHKSLAKLLNIWRKMLRAQTLEYSQDRQHKLDLVAWQIAQKKRPQGKT